MRFLATVVFCLVSICVAQAGNRQTILQFVQDQNHCQQQVQFVQPVQQYQYVQPVQVQRIQVNRHAQQLRFVQPVQHIQRVQVQRVRVVQPVHRQQIQVQQIQVNRPRVTVERRGLFGLRQRVIVD